MKAQTRRFLSLLLALTLLLALFPATTALAASPNTSNMSTSYQSGPYYTKLMQVQLTGNQITDLIAVAASQLGYHESNSASDLTGTGTGTGNCTEYGRFNGTNGYAWCASFVTWCFRKANIPTSIMPTTGGVGTVRLSVYNNGATWHSVDSGYTPKTGDLVLYESMNSGYTYYKYASRDANGVPSSSSHVGIVVSDFNTSTKTYSVIDGNGDEGCVKYLTNQKLYMAGPTKDGGTMNRIQGFVTPAYTTGTGAGYNGSTVDTSLTVSLTAPTDATYLAKQSVSNTNATVVCRIAKTAGSSITKAGLILSQADGTVIKNYSENVTNVGTSTTVFHAWYDINQELGVTLSPGTTYQYRFYAVVNGKTFYGNTYTFQTTGSAPTYTLTFNPAGGTVSPTSKTVVGNNVAGDLPIPTREGYEFLGWYDSSGNIYSASKTVTQSLTLTARWSQEQATEEDAPPTSFGLSLTDPCNSKDQVEVSISDPKLHCKLDKPAGAEVTLFQIRYFDENRTWIGTGQHDFTGDTVLAAKSEADFTIDVSKTFPNFSSLKAGEVRYYACYATIGDLIYITPTQEFVLTSETPAQNEHTVTFYDLDNMRNYGEITQVNGQKYVLPAEPSKLGYQFAGWKINGSIVTANTTVNLTQDALAQATWTKVAAQTGTVFTDVQKGSWYEDAVAWALAQNITTGTTPTTFSPDENCTRAQIITFLWRAAGSPAPSGQNPFSDVGADTYYTKAVTWAYEKGMASGKVFSPNSPCTREMAVDFMWKYAGQPSAPQAGFTDASSAAVNWAVSAGVTTGTTPTTFSPADICTRSQIVTFLYRGFA